MKVSARGLEAQASPIRRLAPYADEAVRSGAKVYYLNIGQPDIPTPDIVMDRIRSYPGTYIPYSPSAGTAEFQKGMSGYYQQHGLPVAPNSGAMSITGTRVAAVLDRIAEERGLPASITVDHGPEFEGQVLDAWAYAQGVRLSFIRPGKPVENAYIESFNGKSATRA